MPATDAARTRRDHAGLLPFVGALAAWTAIWAFVGVGDILTQSDIFRGAAGPTVDVHEVLQLLFVAAYAGIRWATGMAILCAGGAAVWWGTRRGGSRPAPAAESRR